MKRIAKDKLDRIGLVCTACGFVTQPARGYPDGIWMRFDFLGTWPATWLLECSNCDEIESGLLPVTKHFVDTVHP